MTWETKLKLKVYTKLFWATAYNVLCMPLAILLAKICDNTKMIRHMAKTMYKAYMEAVYHGYIKADLEFVAEMREVIELTD